MKINAWISCDGRTTDEFLGVESVVVHTSGAPIIEHNDKSQAIYAPGEWKSVQSEVDGDTK